MNDDVDSYRDLWADPERYVLRVFGEGGHLIVRSTELAPTIIDGVSDEIVAAIPSRMIEAGVEQIDDAEYHRRMKRWHVIFVCGKSCN